MKIVTNVLESIANIQIFPIIGLFIFLIFFIILIYRVIRMDQRVVDEISHLPLQKDEMDNASFAESRESELT